MCARFTHFASVAVLSFTLFGCAATRPRTPPGGAIDAEKQWVSALDRDHPLVGLALDVRRGRWTTKDVVVSAAAASERVFVGEQHDNADHHRFQAEVLAALVKAGKRPTLVAEMLDTVDQPTIDRARTAALDDPDVIARAVQWEQSGWPPWALYRPVFAEAAAARLPVAAAGLDRAASRGLVKHGLGSLDAALVERFGLSEPLPDAAQARLRDEMREAHCGFLPESMLDGMVLVQRARDALLADGAAKGSGGAVVIAGAGHVRTDSGAPRALLRAGVPRALSIALVEVRKELPRAEDYARGFGVPSLPFDYVLFTPRANDEDHCAELRKHHGQQHAPQPAPGATAPSPSSAPPP